MKFEGYFAILHAQNLTSNLQSQFNFHSFVSHKIKGLIAVQFLFFGRTHSSCSLWENIIHYVSLKILKSKFIHPTKDALLFVYKIKVSSYRRVLINLVWFLKLC